MSLEYEAYDELAVTEGNRILTEALGQFPLTRAICVHRVGKLALGEVAIRVEVWSGHREEAFEACRFIIDEVKRRVPIWKKEHYADGVSEWLCPTEPSSLGGATISPEAVYGRQMRLAEIGEEGQRRLAEAKVLVVGAGGLGSPVLLYLAAAGVGSLGIVEDDELSADNLHRQIMYAARDLGKGKAELAADRIRTLNPLVGIDVHPTRISERNALDLVREYDLIVDCTDNFGSKFLLNDVAAASGKVLVQASIYRYEGQIHVFDPGSKGACLRCLWPEAPAEGCVGNCAEVGVLGATAGFFGTLQAMETLKLILGIGEPLREHLLLVDLLSYETMRVTRQQNPNCPVCGQGRYPALEPSVELHPKDLTEIGPHMLIDIREEDEVKSAPIPTAIWVRGADLHAGMAELQGEGLVVLVCEHGVRSLHKARWLRGFGMHHVFSLAGGRARMKVHPAHEERD